MTLKQLCQQMHEKMRELDLMNHISAAVNTDPEPVMTPAAAYQKVLRYKAEHIRLDDFLVVLRRVCWFHTHRESLY